MAPDPSRPAQLTRTKTPETWLAAMPAVFVLLWSTSFIGAKLGSPFAPPFTFLLLRFAVVVAALTLTALALRAPWPRGWKELRRIALVGVLIGTVNLMVAGERKSGGEIEAVVRRQRR